MTNGGKEEAQLRTLLALCARVSVTSNTQDAIKQRATQVSDWPRLLALAEYNGLGPLLYHHVKSSGARLADPIRRQLQGLYVRHKLENQIRLRVLEQVLEAFEDAAILTTVLKGPLLIDQVYRDPGLRPMSDLDLLVPEEQVIRAQLLLCTLGFTVHVPHTAHRFFRRQHLRPALRRVDGVTVLIEIHRDAFDPILGVSLKARTRAPGAMKFRVCDRQACSLPAEEMLWHLCRHCVNLRHRFRLIWAADIVGFSDRFLLDIDWSRVKEHYPFVISTLSLLHCLAPFPESLIRLVGEQDSQLPVDVWTDYYGWPRASARKWDSLRGRLDLLTQTLNPPEWWLRLNYGTGTGPWGTWRAQALHGVALVRHSVRLVNEAFWEWREPGPSVMVVTRPPGLSQFL